MQFSGQSLVFSQLYLEMCNRMISVKSNIYSSRTYICFEIRKNACKKRRWCILYVCFFAVTGSTAFKIVWHCFVLFYLFLCQLLSFHSVFNIDSIHNKYIQFIIIYIYIYLCQSHSSYFQYTWLFLVHPNFMQFDDKIHLLIVVYKCAPGYKFIHLHYYTFIVGASLQNICTVCNGGGIYEDVRFETEFKSVDTFSFSFRILQLFCVNTFQYQISCIHIKFFHFVSYLKCSHHFNVIFGCVSV